MSETSVLRTYHVLDFFCFFNFRKPIYCYDITICMVFMGHVSIAAILLEILCRLKKIKSEDLKNTHVMKNYTKIMKQIIQELFFCFLQPTLPLPTPKD